MRHSLVIFIALPFFLSACSGGGGGGGNSATFAPFVKFTTIAVPSTVRISGASQEASYSLSGSVVSPTSAVTPYEENAYMDARFNDASRSIASATIRSSDGTVATVSSTTVGTTWTEGTTGQTRLLTPSATAVANGWDYQTFGVWVTGYGASIGTFGAFSGGAATDVAAIPTTGPATYNGLAGGLYVSPAGDAYLTKATMTATVSYSARSIAFSTTAPSAVPLSSPSTAPITLNYLATSGTLTYGSTNNSFTGAVTTIGGTGGAAMTGSAEGKFFGPAAQELGGTFGFTDGSARFVGGFGGKK